MLCLGPYLPPVEAVAKDDGLHLTGQITLVDVGGILEASELYIDCLACQLLTCGSLLLRNVNVEGSDRSVQVRVNRLNCPELCLKFVYEGSRLEQEREEGLVRAARELDQQIGTREYVTPIRLKTDRDRNFLRSFRTFGCNRELSDTDLERFQNRRGEDLAVCLAMHERPLTILQEVEQGELERVTCLMLLGNRVIRVDVLPQVHSARKLIHRAEVVEVANHQRIVRRPFACNLTRVLYHLFVASGALLADKLTGGYWHLYFHHQL